MGVYEEIIDIVSNPFKKIKENIKYSLPLAIGAFLSLVIFILLFSFLFENYRKATYILFVGLIIGNIPVIYQNIKKELWQKRYYLYGILAFIVALSLSIWAMNTNQSDIINISLLAIITSGLLTGAVAFIPGMSISMVLIIFGTYNALIHMAKTLIHFDFRFLIPFSIFIICGLIGIFITSNGIKYLLNQYPEISNSLILGFMSGSLLGIIFKIIRMENINFKWSFSMVMFCFGLTISTIFVLLAAKYQES